MTLELNYLAVFVAALLIFVLGGLWYSPVLFAKRWMALIGKSREELARTGSPVNYVLVFLCGLLTAFALAAVLGLVTGATAATGACVGLLCWLGFAGATSFGNAVFSGKPFGLWLIDTGFNLVSFVLAGILLAVWK